jgi:DUF4097 and DUF4098 domain-containing protein YvlB
MRLRYSFVAVALAFGVQSAGAQDAGAGALAAKIVAKERARSYQGRTAEQTERFSRKVRVGRDGRVSVSNISGDITVTGGSGDEVSVEAIKRTRGDRDELSRVQIIVEDRAGHVDVRTDHMGRMDHASVDFTVTVPSSVSLEVSSISGSVKISGVKGSVRAMSVSGAVTATDTPKLESAKSTSGNVSVAGISVDGDVSAASISGNVVLKGVKARGLELGSVSGDVLVSDASCDRFTAKSVSGGIEYSGAISKGGVYDMNSHSGTVRVSLSNPAGFYLNANSFSGSIRSDLPLTIGGDDTKRPGEPARRRGGIGGMNPHEIRGVFGDGSATLTLRTFSGSIVIEKR